MRFAVGLVCVAACATKQAPPPADARQQAAEQQATRVRPREQLTPDVVLATIRSRYLGGVQRCYRRHLKQDASARGRVLVSFTVDPKGRARDGEARGITERVDDCIEAQVARWQFPKPAREARFALGLELRVD
jgi:outer membrane biosynthesis protein TonB